MELNRGNMVLHRSDHPHSGSTWDEASGRSVPLKSWDILVTPDRKLSCHVLYQPMGTQQLKGTPTHTCMQWVSFCLRITSGNELNTILVTTEKIKMWTNSDFFQFLCTFASACAEWMARFSTGCTTQAICDQQRWVSCQFEMVAFFGAITYSV